MPSTISAEISVYQIIIWNIYFIFQYNLKKIRKFSFIFYKKMPGHFCGLSVFLKVVVWWSYRYFWLKIPKSRRICKISGLFGSFKLFNADYTHRSPRFFESGKTFWTSISKIFGKYKFMMQSALHISDFDPIF